MELRVAQIGPLQVRWLAVLGALSWAKLYHAGLRKKAAVEDLENGGKGL